MFRTTGPHYCPVCPLVMVGKNRDRKSAATQLVLSESNYSGCGVDMANCPVCGRGFQLSYKIDEITPAPDWNADPTETA